MRGLKGCLSALLPTQMLTHTDDLQYPECSIHSSKLLWSRLRVYDCIYWLLKYWHGIAAGIDSKHEKQYKKGEINKIIIWELFLLHSLKGPGSTNNLRTKLCCFKWNMARHIQMEYSIKTISLLVAITIQRKIHSIPEYIVHNQKRDLSLSICLKQIDHKAHILQTQNINWND